jgi:hypothetical protein
VDVCRPSDVRPNIHQMCTPFGSRKDGYGPLVEADYIGQGDSERERG